MRDKVKRFISILMTALMLVNLMPVGALADGITSIGYRPEVAASTGYYKVYVYARFDGDPLPGVTLNASQWYTIGYIDNVHLPSPDGSPWYPYYNNNEYCGPTVSFTENGKRISTSASGIIGGLVHQYNTSIVIKSDEWISANFKACPGADTYKEGTDEPTWHLDIIVDINKNPPVHNLVFKVNNSNGKQIGTPKKVTGRWTNPLWANKYYAGNPVPETITDGGRIYQLKTKREGNPNLDTKIYFDEPIKNVEFYYKDMGPVKRNYTVNHYWMGEQNKPIQTETKEADLGSTVTKSPIKIDGYTPVSDASQSITITEGTNVINFYYYKNVELEANSKTVPYNGEEHSVSGYDCSVDGLTFEGITVGAKGTLVGEYPAAFAEDTVGKRDTTGNYIVKEANPGKLTITAATDEVVVTIKENSGTETYDGTEKTVTGYKVTNISNPLYKEGDFTFSGSAVVKGTNAGTYDMKLKPADFTNNNKNFSNVRFEIVDGSLTISPAEVTLTAKSDTKTYNGEEHSVSGYDCSADGLTFEGITVGAKGTLVGEYPAAFAEDTVGKRDTTGNYIVKEANPGKLTITAATDEVVVTIKENSGTETYDGTEKTVTGYKVTNISNPLYKEGDFTFSGKAEVKGTDAGTYDMALKASDFTNRNANFSKVTFVIEDGQLVIEKRKVTLTSASDEKVYDGTALTNDTVTVGGADGFADGEGAAYDVTGSRTDVGESDNTFTYTLNKGTKADNYTIEKAEGKLKVTAVTDEVVVTIKENAGTAKYDGTEKTVTGYTVTNISNKLYAEKDFTFNGKAEVKGTDAGTYDMALKASDFTNRNANFSKVTFVIEDGQLVIEKRKVTLTSGSGEKVYDGTALTKPEVTVSGDGFAKDEGATYNVTGSQTDVGTSDNTFTFEANEGTSAKNYSFEFKFGTLKVTPFTDKVTVTITEKSGTVTYDGGDHIVSGYKSMTANNPLYDVEDYVDETPTEAWTAKGTDAGEYPVGIAADDFKNINTNFENVKFVVVDGALEITPAPITLQASSRSKTYDGTPLEADGYGFYEGNLALADDIESVILTGSQTLVGSSESQITEVVTKKGKNPKNYKFTFLPGTLTVTDGTGDDPVKPENVVTKTHIPKDMGYNLGEPVTFMISVKNIYNTPKTITLTEKANVKFSNGENVIVFNDVPAGETVTAEATYTITSEDILEGGFTNTVTADFTGGGSWTAEDTVTTAELDTTLNVAKISDVPEGQKAALGQKITYTIKVQNAGNVPYTNVKVEDPLTGLTETIETLPVGETRTFTTEYVVTEADVLKGSVLNTATATGDEIKDPKSDEPKEPNGGDEVEIKTFAPITIKPKDVTATYNGAAITGKDVEITSGKLLEGHKLSAAVIGSGVNAGSYALTLDPEKITIVDANNKDVSEMYARTLLPGKLIINKRSVLITSQSATKTYDGSALTRPAVTITGDGFVPGELAKAEATGSITKVGSTPNTIQYTTTGAFNAANYSIALSVGTLTVTEKPKPEPRRTFNLTINYVYQNGKRAAASYNRGGLKNGETFDITSPVIAGYTASETVVSGTIYNRDIKVTVIYTADGVNLDDYGVPLGLGNITMNVGDCFE